MAFKNTIRKSRGTYVPLSGEAMEQLTEEAEDVEDVDGSLRESEESPSLEEVEWTTPDPLL